MGRTNETTEAGKHPYIRKGNYWAVFGHLYESATPDFKKRMEREREQDEKSVKIIDSRYPNVRKV